MDTTPPEVIFTSPANNSVKIKTDRIVLEFSEYVDRRTVEESIFISPYVGQLEFDWGSTDVTVIFSEPLRNNRTYVVNIGTDIVDRRANNRMATGFTLAFSTGDSIDSGMIGGRVFDERPEGVMIFAYALDGLNPDTLNPSFQRPDYIVQTGKHGNFTLSNLTPGRYRVFAIRDEYRDLVYDKQVDQYGVATNDVVLTTDQQHVENVWFRLAKEDTSRPFLASVSSIDRTQFQIRFSEPVDSVAFPQAIFTLTDTFGTHPVAILLTYLRRADFSTAGVIPSTPLDSGSAYRLTATNIIDRAGNMLDTTHASVIFVASGISDTLPPTLVFTGLRDSIRGYPFDEPLILSFPEPVEQQRCERGIVLQGDTGNIPVSFRWLNATDCAVVPVLPLASKSWYQLMVRLDSVRDLQGNSWEDSTSIVRFETRDLRLAGTIEGTVVDQDEGASGEIIITALRVDATFPESRTLSMQEPGKFVIDQLPEGRYTLHAFRDTDSSHHYSPGRPFPFVPSERFITSNDTLKVRARWNVEGVLLKFR